MRIVCVFILIIFLSCNQKDKIPSELIQQKEMQSVLWDVLRAQAMAEEISHKDSTINLAYQTKLLTQKVFEIHKINTAIFNESYSWYTKHPQVLKVIFDSLSSQKRKNTNDLMKQKYQKRKIKDSLYNYFL